MVTLVKRPLLWVYMNLRSYYMVPLKIGLSPRPLTHRPPFMLQATSNLYNSVLRYQFSRFHISRWIRKNAVAVNLYSSQPTKPATYCDGSTASAAPPQSRNGEDGERFVSVGRCSSLTPDKASLLKDHGLDSSNMPLPVRRDLAAEL